MQHDSYTEVFVCFLSWTNEALSIGETPVKRIFTEYEPSYQSSVPWNINTEIQPASGTLGDY